jgi:FkbM family methyltransferase
MLAAPIALLLLAVALSALAMAMRSRGTAREAVRRNAQLKASTTAARARVTEVTSRLEDARTRLAILHHAIPEPEVLEGMLPLRLPGAVARAAQADAVARQTRFAAASAAYASELAAGAPATGDARPMTLQGLTWWVPIANRRDAAGADRNAAHQDFPYRAIAQTRDVSVGGIMLDLGANVGRMSVPRVILGDVQAAYCAEPDPLNYSCLVRNAVDNGLAGLMHPDRLAIGAENGVVRLHRARSAGGHRVLDPEAPSRGDVVEVQCLTLDTWVERLGIDLQQVSFIKVDVQGSEMGVLRGARNVLACRHIAWQIEIDPATLAHRGHPVDDVYAELARHFTHAIDLSRHVGGSRTRPITELAEALSYLAAPDAGRTDVLLFSVSDVGIDKGGSQQRNQNLVMADQRDP